MDEPIYGMRGTLYRRIELPGGPPRERAVMTPATVNKLISSAMLGHAGRLAELVIKVDDGTELDAHDIERLARYPGRPSVR